MAHFAVTVCLPGELTRDELLPHLRNTLARYDREREMEPYVEYTRAELIALGRRSISVSRDPDRSGWTDQQVYDHWISRYEPWEIGPDGETYTTRNPQGQWDYWSIGGLFDPMWILTDENDGGVSTRTEMARLREISADSLTATYAFIDLNGDWHQRRQAPYWDEDPVGAAEWDHTYAVLIAALPPDTWLIQVDCHS
ncbi:hypothetical protein VMT65_11115 [Nocardia sp. CDC153]|uniref:hypothetical protein n=1 Tax=Nocardia sp. CDC153 TaxID=3112167 RepID=UPI002DB629BB|nr:hypothetical protein [Nocardia sp. CDC153]MEC3953583.1 hypothetical protein [Nocardia sp. CDC153]